MVAPPAPSIGSIVDTTGCEISVSIGGTADVMLMINGPHGGSGSVVRLTAADTAHLIEMLAASLRRSAADS